MRWFRANLGNLTWSSDGTDFVNITRGNYLRRIILKLYGTFTLAAGSTAGTARSESPANIIKQIRVVGNEFGDIKRFDGTGLYLSTMYHNKCKFDTIVPAGDAAGQTFLGLFTLDFALPAKNNLRPADTFLDTRLFSTLKLEVDWSNNLRDATRSGCDRTETNPVAHMIVIGEYERPHTDFGNPLAYVQTQSSKSVLAAGDLEYEIPVNERYKNIIMTAQNKAAGGQYTGNDAIITEYDLERDANVYPLKKINFVLQQYLDQLDFELDAIHTGANMNQFDLDRSIMESLNTYGGSTLKYKLVVTTPAGDNKIVLYPGMLRKIPLGANGMVCVPAADMATPLVKSRAAKSIA